MLVPILALQFKQTVRCQARFRERLEMKLVLTLQMDNAAFDPDWQQEASRILEAASRKVLTQLDNSGPTSCKLTDVNGNTVGTIRVTGKPSTH